MSQIPIPSSDFFKKLVKAQARELLFWSRLDWIDYPRMTLDELANELGINHLFSNDPSSSEEIPPQIMRLQPRLVFATCPLPDNFSFGKVFTGKFYLLFEVIWLNNEEREPSLEWWGCCLPEGVKNIDDFAMKMAGTIYFLLQSYTSSRVRGLRINMLFIDEDPDEPCLAVRGFMN